MHIPPADYLYTVPSISSQPTMPYGFNYAVGDNTFSNHRPVQFQHTPFRNATMHNLGPPIGVNPADLQRSQDSTGYHSQPPPQQSHVADAMHLYSSFPSSPSSDGSYTKAETPAPVEDTDSTAMDLAGLSPGAMIINSPQSYLDVEGRFLTSQSSPGAQSHSSYASDTATRGSITPPSFASYTMAETPAQAEDTDSTAMESEQLSLGPMPIEASQDMQGLISRFFPNPTSLGAHPSYASDDATWGFITPPSLPTMTLFDDDSKGQREATPTAPSSTPTRNRRRQSSRTTSRRRLPSSASDSTRSDDADKRAGNNPHGSKGCPICCECRKRKGHCEYNKDPVRDCDWCKSKGIKCGPKLSKQQYDQINGHSKTQKCRFSTVVLEMEKLYPNATSVEIAEWSLYRWNQTMSAVSQTD
jgi:hypothetical protein